MYRYYVNKRKPLSFWLLDDTVPFQEYSGFGASGGKKAGTNDPTQAIALVAGSNFSSVFNKASIGQFAQNVFKRGTEQRPFALESWVLPIPKSSGNTTPVTGTNLITNPQFATATTGWGAYGQVTQARTAATGADGFNTGYLTLTATSVAADSGSSYTFTAVVGQTYTGYWWARNSGGSALNVRMRHNGGSTNYTIPNDSAWHVYSYTFTASNTSEFFRPIEFYTGGTLNGVVDLDLTVLVTGSTVPTYFDGNTPGYAWSGTANASTSVPVTGLSTTINYATNPTGNGGTSTTGWGNIGAAAGGITAVVDATAPVGGGYLRKTNTDTQAGGLGATTSYVMAEGTYTISMWVRLGGTSTAGNVQLYCQGTAARTGGSAGPFTPGGTWTRISTTITVTRPGTVQFGAYKTTGNAANDTVEITGLLVTKTSSLSNYFDGNYAGALFTTGAANTGGSAYVLSASDQSILSHDQVFDGLSINGKVIRFGTSYTNTGDAFCTYDLIEGKLAHCVGIHTADQNQLWVNGNLVASVDITDAQKADTYIAAADGNLYSGYTISSQEIAMNGVAIYTSLSGDQIGQNWAAGNDVLGQHRVYPQYSGLPFDLDAGDGSIYIDKTWATAADFGEGLKNNVEYGPESITPTYVAGLSVAGTWTVAMPLDGQGDTSIYGVMLEWSSYNVIVEWSLDGTTWTTAKNGELISGITSGYNPTNKDLQVRVTMGSGLATDPAYLESLRMVALRNNTITPTAARTVTISGAAVPRGDYEPTLMRDDNGVNLHGGTLTIGTDTTADPEVARTLEVWIKPLSGTPTFSVSGTQYRNGAASSSIVVGEWQLIHIVAAADISTAITITGDCIVGQVTLYPTALTSGDVAFIENSYAGATAVRFTETDNTLTVTEAATPTSVYAHDWAIDGAG